MNKIKANCTWAEGPDIMIILNNTRIVLYEDIKLTNNWKHGVCDNGSIDLTVEEAKELVISLQQSIKEVEKLEKSYSDYINNKKEEE